MRDQNLFLSLISEDYEIKNCNKSTMASSRLVEKKLIETRFIEYRETNWWKEEEGDKKWHFKQTIKDFAPNLYLEM